MNKKQLLVALAAACAPSLMAVTPLWMRDVKISPDGKQIAFTYKGDIYTVPTQGGTAKRVTTAPSYESNPVWSPAGDRIAFASDRNGNFDVFIVDANGGTPTRLTFDSASVIPETFNPEGTEVMFSAAIQDPASSALFPSARMTELYAVPVKGGASRQVLATPAQLVNWGTSKSKDGWFLYQDQKGFEDEWRKHHTSSVTRDIWRYDAATGKHTNLTNRPGEDRNPIVAGDKFFFLSERDGGSMNVYEADLANPKHAKAITSFKQHPVRFLSSGGGTLCFAYDGEIYTAAPGAKPVKVNIDIVDEDTNQPEKLAIRSGASEVAPSPDGKSVAFIARGDVFVTSAEYATTKQVTNTVEGESDLVWAPDGKALYYTSERDGAVNIYKAEMGRDEDLNFPNATVIKETAMFKADGTQRMVPKISPDGKKMAFIANRNKLMVMDLDSKKLRQLTDGSMNPERTWGFEYSWSPDSRWIVSEVIDRKHDPYSDIALINVADGKVTNLTNTGYFASNARWALDGNAILFISDRYGMRNHASWGSQYDAMMVFLNQDAYDRFRLSEEDYALRKELDKKNKKDDKKKDDKESKEEKDSVKPIEVELDGIADRTVRLTPSSVAMRDAIVSKDGENLYYLMSAPNGVQLWKMNLRKEDDHKMLTKVNGVGGFAPADDGKSIFLLGRNIQKLDPKSDKLTSVSYSSSKTLDHAAEREYMFDYVAREEGERFYNKGMHGVNWPELTKHYRRFMPHIANNYDFAELLSEMLGELNVSHTGGRYSHPGNASDDDTASLGLLYDMSYTGNGLKVDEVVVGGPFNNSSSKVVPGVIVEKINGVELKAGTDHASLLNDIRGKKTLVSLRNPANGEKWDEVILPISKSKFNALLYDRWVKQRAADVDRWSNGRLGYVHIQSMADPSFRTLYSDVLGKYNDRDGIVIDIRWNGGGRLHEDIEVMFTGEKYLTQEIRGVDVCDMPSRRWNKPSIMVMSEACYSNAHGTPWVYKKRNIGKLVGAPVPGTMTSVNWVTMQDPTMVFGIPVIGYRTAEGTYLENSQLDPDIFVLNSPETVVKGEDTQLRTAVEELLKDIDAKKK